MVKRVLLKISGEALSSDTRQHDPKVLSNLALEIKEIIELGIEVAIVVGGGNIMRGKQVTDLSIERYQADYMGMLATVINAIAVQGALEHIGVETRVQSAIEMREVAEPFILRRATRHLEKGRVVIFGAGTGHPYFSTDTTAALRASEIDADVILMAKNGVEGVYDKDPRKNTDAIMFNELTHKFVLEHGLEIMDSTAASLCKDNSIDLIVFNMNQEGNIKKASLGEKIGTVVK